MQRFETLLTDLLEISRYDAGSVQLELEATSLAHLAEDVIASMEQLAEQHGSDVRLVAPGGYSPVDMDPRRVRRVVRNLLENARVHAGGATDLRIRGTGTHAMIVVDDEGTGVPAADRDRIFEPFHRASTATRSTGAGLGLSIVRQIARAHGGTVEYSPRPEGGSRFTVTLPR